MSYHCQGFHLVNCYLAQQALAFLILSKFYKFQLKP